MEIQYHVHYSANLQRHMEFKVYGHGGKPVLFIPCQGGRFFDFENFKMTQYWGPWIESGKVTVYSIDTIDGETWANKGGDNRWRIENHEKWFNYITTELVPAINHIAGQANGFHQGIMTFGASLGGMHAANLFFRRPDLFDAVFAISGLYDSEEYFGGYMDEILYRNTPNAFLSNMPDDHYYKGMYNDRQMLFVVGQGAWEDVLLASTRRLDEVLRRKDIHGQVEYWGYDVDHDWPWWYKMVAHYVPQLLG